ncbi:MAG: riboflavin biosynthesis protein RibF, partial [Muribaculaceae bacterium]|nr:riboflavin biosynthesis protein RibF [Muribaculaceae bacterium]
GYAAVVGTFDGVHRGHRYLIDRLISRAGAAGLATRRYTFTGDPLATIAPGRAPAPLLSLKHKEQLLRKTGVDDLRIDDFAALRSLTARQYLERLVADGVALLIVGHDNRFGSDGLRTLPEFQATAQGLPITIEQAPELTIDGRPVCSSAIRALIARGDIAAANTLLGYPYEIAGRVIRGRQLGRTIGFPTANILPDDPSLLLPPTGVYTAIATTGGSDYPAMLNIGHRPTVDRPDAPISIEAHIIGLHADLYDTTLTLSLRSHLRPEQRFDSVDSLRRQLVADREATVDFFSTKQ